MTEAVRTALVAMLEGVSGIGRVHPYERFAKTTDAMAALYAVGGAVRGWHVQRLAARRRLLASGRVLVTATWTITGFVSLVDADASEIATDVLIDAVVAAERVDPTLGGVVRGLPVDGVAGVQLVESDTVMFANVLCHRARLALTAQTFEGAADGDLVGVADAAGRLIGAIVERLAEETDAFDVIEGRLAWDPDDDPGGAPAAIVTPIGEVARLDPTSSDLDERVDIRVAVIVTAGASYAASSGGALAAGGLEALAEAVRVALHGWQPPQVEVALLYAGAQPVAAAPGFVAWRMTFQPSVYIEAE